MKRVTTALALAALAAAAYWSLRLAYADYLFRRNELADVERAARLSAGNAAFHLRQAQLLALIADNDDAVARALGRAVAFHPRDSAAWMELGLRAEMRGDWSSAERSLLEAARWDRTYQPRHTLAQYYFRRGNRGEFWRWMREALEISPGEMGPLFRLCWSLTEDAAEIAARAIPERREVLRQYLAFLLASGRLEAAKPVAARLLHQTGEAEVPLLVDYCDRLLYERRGTAAKEVWDRLADGNLRLAPRGQGFDWRLPRLEGVAGSRDDRQVAIRLTFSGRQPEQCEPLWQFLALAPATAYRFEFRYRTQGIEPGSGLRWDIQDITAAPASLAESGSLSSERWQGGQLEFTTPARLRLARLTLAYRRSLGTTRIAGSISLRQLRVTPITAR